MNNNFKAFEFGIRIAPGLAVDPVTGKLGEIYWSTARNVLRICVNDVTPIWQDLFIAYGTVNDSTLRWDVAANAWIADTNFLLSANRAYTPNGVTGTNIEIKAGNSTGAGNNGADVVLIGGTGGAGGNQGNVLINSPQISSISGGTGPALLIKAGNSTTPGIDGGDLTIQGGSGIFVPGASEITQITTRADVNTNLNSTFFYLNAPEKLYYVWFQLNVLSPQAEIITVTINNTGASLVTGGPGLYWLLYTPLTTYYVWYNTGTETDPVVPGAIAIPVTVLNTDTTAQVAIDTQAAFASFSDFVAAPAIGNTVQITNSLAGKVTDPSAGTSASTFAINTYGYNIAVDPNIPGRQGIPVLFAANDSANTIATSLVAAVNSVSSFTAPAPVGNVATVTNTVTGPVAPAVDVTVGAPFAVAELVAGAEGTGETGDVDIIAGDRVAFTAERIGLNAISPIDPDIIVGETQTGDIYYNSTYNRFKKYDGSIWTWIEHTPYISDIVVVNYQDKTALTLPTSIVTLIDGSTIADGNLVLFTNLVVSPNKVWRAHVVGPAVSWTIEALGQDEGGSPTVGDIIYVKQGASNANAVLKYTTGGWDDISGNALSVVNQNQGMKIVKGGIRILSGHTLTWTADAYVQIPGIDDSRNTIPAGSVILVNPASVAYVTIHRDAGIAATLTVTVADISTVPQVSPAGDDIVIFARRVDNEYYWGLGQESDLDRGIFTQVSLLDNTSGGTVFSQVITLCDTVVLDYIISRDTDREVGTLYLVTDGINATVSGDDVKLGNVGVIFGATVLAGSVFLTYDTTNTGFTGIMRYKARKMLSI